MAIWSGASVVCGDGQVRWVMAAQSAWPHFWVQQGFGQRDEMPAEGTGELEGCALSFTMQAPGLKATEP